jgi:hypothetical protein
MDTQSSTVVETRLANLRPRVRFLPLAQGERKWRKVLFYIYPFNNGALNAKLLSVFLWTLYTSAVNWVCSFEFIFSYVLHNLFSFEIFIPYLPTISLSLQPVIISLSITVTQLNLAHIFFLSLAIFSFTWFSGNIPVFLFSVSGSYKSEKFLSRDINGINAFNCWGIPYLAWLPHNTSHRNGCLHAFLIKHWAAKSETNAIKNLQP